MKKYLFIAAHTDDAELLFGGTIAKMAEQGKDVTIFCLSQVYEGKSLKKEWLESMKVLNPSRYYINNFKVREFHAQRQSILQMFYDLNNEGFDFVYTHHPNDIHSDHKTVGEESIRAFKNTNLICGIGEWNQRTQTKNYFIRLKYRHIVKKLHAIAQYKSQKEKTYCQESFTIACARVNGVIAGATSYAEAFHAINLIQ